MGALKGMHRLGLTARGAWSQLNCHRAAKCYKTQMCKFFAKGTCNKGVALTHAEIELGRNDQ
eukprot:374698-Amphidinium_carterae.1